MDDVPTDEQALATLKSTHIDGCEFKILHSHVVDNPRRSMRQRVLIVELFNADDGSTKTLAFSAQRNMTTGIERIEP